MSPCSSGIVTMLFFKSFKQIIKYSWKIYYYLARWWGSLGCTSSLKFIILRALFWALWTMTSNVIVALSPNDSKWSLILARIPFSLFNFCFKVLMWSLKSKSLSNKTLRYLVQVFCLIFWPLKHESSLF